LSLSQGTFLTQGSQHRESIGSSVSETKQYSGNKRARGGGGGEAISKNGSMVEVSEDEEDQVKRRQDRNLREQHRSQRITQQIDHLRSVLAEAQIRHKPDKFSTLITVGEYIKQLQERSAMLDVEHKKLIDTITRTNELANQPLLPVASNPSCDGPDKSVSSSSGLIPGATNTIYNDDELVFVRNVDYKCIFIRCGVPLVVASIDGRILDCNHAFEEMTGHKREEILPTEYMSDDSVTTGADGISSMSSSEALTNLSGGVEGTQTTQKGESGEQTEKRNNSDSRTLSRNLSLFNLLSRDCMEKVFLALSRILKHPTLDGDDNNRNTAARDFWSGTVRLNRNYDIEVGCLGQHFSIFSKCVFRICSKNCRFHLFSLMQMRLNLVLVRNTEGKAKFFNCYFAPASQSYR
jgi:PAS domain-containing protein